MPSGPQEFSDRVQIHAGHYQSTGEGMAIAMPRIVFESGPRYGGEKPSTRTLAVREYWLSIRLFSQAFECGNCRAFQGNVPWISIPGLGQVHLAAFRVGGM